MSVSEHVRDLAVRRVGSVVRVKDKQRDKIVVATVESCDGLELAAKINGKLRRFFRTDRAGPFVAHIDGDDWEIS